MAATGPSFMSLQVRNLDRAAAFYEQQLGLERQAGPPHAIVFNTAPIAFAVRQALPGVDLASTPQPGLGVGVWLHAANARQIHDALVADGVRIATAPVDGPFGWTFTFVDPDGYHITLHDQA